MECKANRTSSKYLFSFNCFEPVLEPSLHLSVVLGEIPELSNVSREHGDFFVHICL